MLRSICRVIAAMNPRAQCRERNPQIVRRFRDTRRRAFRAGHLAMLWQCRFSLVFQFVRFRIQNGDSIQ